MLDNEKKFYISQLRAYYKEVIAFFIILFVVFLKAPAWVPMLVWGLILIERGQKYQIFEVLWDKCLKEVEKRKLKEFEEKKAFDKNTTKATVSKKPSSTKNSKPAKKSKEPIRTKAPISKTKNINTKKVKKEQI